ncbi:MAG: Asp-tRNA(Asn)/Glu-tRNA(Gln) amidotransferase GatCAB subunit A, partial [candidate division Zixibacteria bacterium]|nr:Asp-tRNA(Asn)/Glu-tRNA(Gln) amidotransferase GatCAB subunit A [candidate division Zixibacteria bacterium]
TGGSIRVPASLCGVVGLKPTYGRISRRGVAPLSWSLDHVGPMTRTVKDAAILLNVLAGPDPADPTCAQTPVPDYTAGIDEGVKDLRIGISADLFTRMDGEVETVTRKAIAALEAMGAQTESVTIPLWDEALTAAIVLLNAEAVAVHETHLKNRPEDYGPDVRIRLEQGLFVTALEYVKAQRLRSLLAKDMTRLFEKIDVLVGPATPVAALSPDRETVTLCGHTEDPRAALTRTTRFHNLLGLPSISVPCGVTVNGLPIGLQIAAASFYEATVLRVAHVCEQTSGWVSKHPSVG